MSGWTYSGSVLFGMIPSGLQIIIERKTMKNLIWSALGIAIGVGIIYLIKSKTDELDRIPEKYTHLYKKLKRVK